MAKPVYQGAELWQMGLLILSLVVLSEGRRIEVANGGRWGSWLSSRMCPTGFYAYGFSLRVEGSQGRGDDTALNGIRLYCKHKANLVGDMVVEESGHWGSWTSVQYCSGFIDSFQLNVEPPQGNGDDTAANNMNVHCNDGNIINGYGLSWGNWGEFSYRCSSGVCGFQVKMEGPQGNGDDTALNDVDMICC